MFGRVATALHRMRWLVLALGVAVVAIATVATGGLANRLTNGLDDYDDPGGGNVAARQLIEHATGVDSQQGYLLLVRTRAPVTATSPPPPEVTAARQVLRDRREVRSVVDYSTARDAGLISRDGRQTVVIGQLGPIEQAASKQAVADLQRRIAADPRLAGRTLLGGATPGHVQLGAVTTKDLARAEGIATPILLVLLVFVFRGVVAALLPMVGGLFSILLALLGMRVLTSFMNVSSGGLNLAAALGLGLSIDFGLLVVSRYREELGRSGPGVPALVRTYATAGRTVAFSCLTVSAALATLTVFPQPYLRSMGLSGILTVTAAAVFALLVLPATLAVLGGRVNALAPKRWRRRADRPAAQAGPAGQVDPAGQVGQVGQGHWHRIASAVMRRPAMFATAAVVLLLLIASPILGVRFSGVDPADLPHDSDVSAGQVAVALQRDFAAPPTDPLKIVVTAPASAGPDLARYRSSVRTVSGVDGVSAVRRLDANHWELDAVLADALGARAEDTVRLVRALPSDHPVRFTGQTADLVAQKDSLGRHLPIAGGALVLVTLVLLFVFTGSVLLPVQALLMNALSVSAALGVLVWVFQGGHLAGLIDATQVSALEETSPILLFALAFGLSTDYNLFLLARVKEIRDGGVGHRQAVASGVERTGSMVTSAAVLFCIAVGALVMSRITLIKELGLGTAFAVLVDATVVRALLVPSLMGLLGRATWWAPRPLRRLHAALGLGHPHDPVPAAGLADRADPADPDLVGAATD